ncbi:hypothetical protein NA56DRAFT_696977 [Hyaloscypha hepaticicola]|uniref:Uncharacterized protein n=1 Tax=Hyaloscypha hepaticicola TaxID=2082293 RepID=A0A2J6QNW8_9HELO|nr:hypothetical protein NA56DRAFT_696977 [Hyaloscypha hepaticicola]
MEIFLHLQEHPPPPFRSTSLPDTQAGTPVSLPQSLSTIFLLQKFKANCVNKTPPPRNLNYISQANSQQNLHRNNNVFVFSSLSARCRARGGLAEHPEYRAAITANPALQQVMDLALVAQIRQMYQGRNRVHQGALEGQIAGARAGGLSTTALEASRRPRPRRGAGLRTAGGSRGGGALGSGGVLGGGVGGASFGAGGMGGMGGDSRGGVSRSGLGSSSRGDPEASLGQPSIIIPVFFPSGRAALRPALVANLAAPRHIYVAFIHAFVRSNYPDQTVGTVLPLLRAEFPDLHLPDV